MAEDDYITSYYTNNTTNIPPEITNPCPNQRAISRPLLFVHNYSLFVFGSILNILAFIVLIQRSLRCHSTFAHLAFLSLSNGLLTLVRFIQWMATYYFHLHVENNLYTCRLSHFALDFLTHFSLYTLVCVNIDRARAVLKTRPARQYPKATFKKVIIKESVIAMILCAYHFHWIVKFGYEDYDGIERQTICNSNPVLTPRYFYFLSTIYPIFELIIFFGLPLITNILCTIIIVRSLHIRMRKAKRFERPTQLVTVSTRRRVYERIHRIFSCCIPQTTIVSHLYSCFCFQIRCRSHSKLRIKIGRNEKSLTKFTEHIDTMQRRQSLRLASCTSEDIQQNTATAASTIFLQKKHRIRRIRDIHLSAMLITLTVLYLICNLPFNFYQTFGKILYQQNANECIVKFTHLLLDILQQTYFSTNFFLYVLTNTRFREEFCNTIMRFCTRQQLYSIKRNNRQKRRQNMCLTASATHFNGLNNDCQMASFSIQQNPDTNFWDMELTEGTSLKKQNCLEQN